MLNKENTNTIWLCLSQLLSLKDKISPEGKILKSRLPVTMVSPKPVYLSPNLFDQFLDQLFQAFAIANQRKSRLSARA